MTSKQLMISTICEYYVRLLAHRSKIRRISIILFPIVAAMLTFDTEPSFCQDVSTCKENLDLDMNLHLEKLENATRDNLATKSTETTETIHYLHGNSYIVSTVGLGAGANIAYAIVKYTALLGLVTIGSSILILLLCIVLHELNIDFVAYTDKIFYPGWNPFGPFF